MKRHNPPDSTFRNVTALKKRVTTLERLLKDRTMRLDRVERGGTVNAIAIRKLREELLPRVR